MFAKDKVHDTWKLVLWSAIALSLVLFIIELSFDLSEKTHYLLQIIEYMLLTIFAIDLGMHFFEAENKKIFLKKNWYMFLLFIPFLQNMEFLHGTRLFTGITEGASAAKGMFAGEEAMMIAARGMKIGAHIQKGFRTPEIRISRYIAPNTDPEIAEGIKQGIDAYLRKKLKITPKYEDKNWYDMFKIEQQFNVPIKSVDGERFFQKIPENSIVITAEKLRFRNPTFKGISDLKKKMSFLSTTYGLDYKNDLHLDTKYLKKLRGFITAYNTAVHSTEYERCFHPNCVHSVINNKRLDNLAFMFHLNKELPRCDKHI